MKRGDERPLTEVASSLCDAGQFPRGRTHAVGTHHDAGLHPAFLQFEGHAGLLDPDSPEPGGPKPAYGRESGKPRFHRISQSAVLDNVSEGGSSDIGGIEVNLAPPGVLPHPHFRERVRPAGLDEFPDPQPLQNRPGSRSQCTHPGVVTGGGTRAWCAGFYQGHLHARGAERGTQRGAHRSAPDDRDVVHHGASPRTMRLAGKPSPIA